jgi:hypothetical protein
MESEAGIGGSGSTGVLTTIEGVVRIPCVGAFAGRDSEIGGMGILSAGLGGLVRTVFVLEDVWDNVL